MSPLSSLLAQLPLIADRFASAPVLGAPSGPPSSNRRKQTNKKFYNYCKRPGHNIETCYCRNKSTAAVANTEPTPPMPSISAESQSSGSTINLSLTELQEIIAQAVRMAGNASLSTALSDPRTGQELGTDPRVGRMFPMDNLHLPHVAPVSVAAAAAAVSSLPSLALWHSRLGHASSTGVQQLAFKGLLGSVSKDNFDCTSYESPVPSTDTLNPLLDFSIPSPDIFDDSPRQVVDEQVDDELSHLEPRSPATALPEDPPQDIPPRHSTRTLENATIGVLNDGVDTIAQPSDFLSDSKTGSVQINVTVSDGCFPRIIRGLHLPSSPFQFKTEKYYLDNYALFNCTPGTDKIFRPIHCLSSRCQLVYAFQSNLDIEDLPILSCTKMYSVSSVPSDIWNSPFLELTWSEPKCGPCEVKGEKCRLKVLYSIQFPLLLSPQLIMLKSFTVFILGPFLLALAVYAFYHVYCYDKTEKENQARIEKFLEDYKALKPTRYSYANIKRITNQLSEKLGQGAYGTVFKGKLSSEIHVAVKILNIFKGDGEEFINEVGTMGKIHHVNVVRLVGFCADGFRRALVYEFLPNDSLDKFISPVDSNSFLGWEKLHDIALGIAKGIEYLHQGCDQQILHFDIKPHNILLDQNFNPKISDFGLAKLCAKDQSAVSMTTARGTIGYIAPEVFSRNFGKVSYKSDIYSFGIVLLEMVGGRKNFDLNVETTSQIYFPDRIYNLLEQKEDLRVYVEDSGDAKLAKKLAIVGLWCIQWHPTDRPSVKSVVQMLEGKGDKLTIPPNPFASTSSRRVNENMPTRRLIQELEVIPESD
nr:rust resistance kinase Lr10-like [Quercus suber]